MPRSKPKPQPKPQPETSFTVPVEEAGKRLDVFLSSRLPALSRNRVQALLEGGHVIPEFPGKTIKAGFKVSVGQSFRVRIPPPEKPDLAAQPLDLDIVFEDAHLLVVDKPVGLVVHPGAGNPDKTLLNALIAHCPDIQGVGGVQRPGLVHRLDKDTSGLLVVAKSDLAFKALVSQLKTRVLSREYLGIVEGRMDEEGTVDAPVGRHPGSRQKMAVRPLGGKKAVTRFRALSANDRASLLLMKLETGRTHQIRVHMAFAGHPILGDSVYGGGEPDVPRQMLHAFRLALKHPKTGIVKRFFAPPPADLRDCLAAVGLKEPDWRKVAWK